MGMDKLSLDTEIGKCQKYVGSCCGNSFLIVDCREKELSKDIKSFFSSENTDKYGVDSVLFLEKSKRMDVFMKIFEKDGSESDSCGNGTILIAYLLGINDGKVEMKDNAAMIKGDSKKQAILMSERFSELRKIDNGNNRVFIKMGEPHIVCLVDDMEKFDLVRVGRELQKDYPEGVNVDAIQKVNESCYLIKTYERGVFNLTKSCGTGSLSSYVAISYFNGKMNEGPIEFKSMGGSHWVSRENNMIRLETLKNFCKIKSI